MGLATWGFVLLIIALFASATNKIPIRGINRGRIMPGQGPYSGPILFEIKPGFSPFRGALLLAYGSGIPPINVLSKFVYDGQPTDSDALLYSVTQGNRMPLEVRARRHSLATVVFTPDAATTNTTLELYFYTSVLCEGSVTLTAQEGSISSGPGPYASRSCKWRVAPSSVPIGHRLKFRVIMQDIGLDDCLKIEPRGADLAFTWTRT
ncbi:hypothetical protein PAPYR_6264 [Paratrimastix pyriformis]|uniref:CUB domain-containing protein n=1 Tax=Paratrimastix pyriformis TaxID=342808 RepID=A0ABQ8UFU7_9EUKA|nr:hypothetical protein PAPYR_6264 [Paratrimastix pyriformis]